MQINQIVPGVGTQLLPNSAPLYIWFWYCRVNRERWRCRVRPADARLRAHVCHESAADCAVQGGAGEGVTEGAVFFKPQYCGCSARHMSTVCAPEHAITGCCVRKPMSDTSRRLHCRCESMRLLRRRVARHPVMAWGLRVPSPMLLVELHRSQMDWWVSDNCTHSEYF